MGQISIGESQDYGNSGDSIPVKLLDGSFVNAIAATPINTSKVLVATTNDGIPYVFANLSGSAIGDREITRTQPRLKTAIALEYPFKVLTKGDLILLQGFDNDVEITTSGELIGLVNTGDGYIVIVRDGNSYLFKTVNNGVITQTLLLSQFDNDYIPSFTWNCGDTLYASKNFSNTESEHSFNCNLGLELYSASWANLGLAVPPFGVRIAKYNTTSFYVPTTVVCTETWTRDLSGTVANCNQTVTLDWLGYSRPYILNYTIPCKNITLELYDNNLYKTQLHKLTSNGLSNSQVTVVDELTVHLNKEEINDPTTNNAYVINLSDVTDSYADLNRTFSNLTYSFAKSDHKGSLLYTKHWDTQITKNKYLYNYKHVSYFYGFEWNDSGTGTANSSGVILDSNFYSGSSSPDWTIEFDDILGSVGGNQYIRGYIWHYRAIDSNGTILPGYYSVSEDDPRYGYNPIDDSAQTVSRQLEYFDFNDQHGGVNGDGWKPWWEPYLYATKPSLTTPVLQSETWYGYIPSADVTQESYSEDIYEHNVDNFSTINLLISTINEQIAIYYQNTKESDYESIYFNEYTKSFDNTITQIRNQTSITTENHIDPSTYSLTVKLNSIFYEITDFNKNSGFNWNSRFYCYSFVSISQPSLGNNTFNCYFKIGLHDNNKGNYTKIIKQFENNSQTQSVNYIYHNLTEFNPVGLNVNVYWTESGNTTLYKGTVINTIFDTGSNSYGEEWKYYTGLTINLTSSETISFFAFGNGLCIVPENDYTSYLLSFMTSSYYRQFLNLYEVNDTFRVGISKELSSDNLNGEDEWYADIYEFDTVEKKFVRIGNESGSLSEITGTEYDFVSYYPV